MTPPLDTGTDPRPATRGRALLLKAAKALEDGRSPLDRSFLIENSVTADECLDLAEGMAAAIRFTDGMIGLAQDRRRIRREATR